MFDFKSSGSGQQKLVGYQSVCRALWQFSEENTSDKEEVSTSSFKPAPLVLASTLALAVLWLWHTAPRWVGSLLTESILLQAHNVFFHLSVPDVSETIAWEAGRILLSYTGTARSAGEFPHPEATPKQRESGGDRYIVFPCWTEHLTSASWDLFSNKLHLGINWLRPEKQIPKGDTATPSGSNTIRIL